MRLAQESLAKSPLAGDMTVTELAKLAASARIWRVTRDEVVLSAMEKADRAVVLIAGSFAVRSVPSGHEAIRVGPGNTVGELSMFCEDVRQFTLQCVSEDGVCVLVTIGDYQAALNTRYATFRKKMDMRCTRMSAITCPYIDPGRGPAHVPNSDDGDEGGDEDDEDIPLTPQMAQVQKYLRRRRRLLSQLCAQLGGSYSSVPPWEEANKMWPKVHEPEKVRLYHAIKALAVGDWSGGFCPHFSAPFDCDDASVKVSGDRESYTRLQPPDIPLLSPCASGRTWTSVLIDPPVLPVQGETYIEWEVEGASPEPLEALVGICGDSAAKAVRNGKIAWKQSDAFMYYLGSGFKFCGGTSLNYSAATSAGPQVMPGDTVGLLVQTYAISKVNPAGATLTLYVNGKIRNLLFSERGLQRGQAGDGATWPAVWEKDDQIWEGNVWFVVDILTPGVTLRLLRNKTWHISIPSVTRKDARYPLNPAETEIDSPFNVFITLCMRAR